MSDFTCKFIDLVTLAETACAYPPLGLREIKLKWQFSTEFPLGCNASISTDNLQFIKGDATYLKNKWDTYGECAAVGLNVQVGGLSIDFRLDFSAVVYDENFFEVGAKYTSLLDRIKVLDNKKIDFSGYLNNIAVDTDLNVKFYLSTISDIAISRLGRSIYVNSGTDFNSQNRQEIKGLPIEFGGDLPKEMEHFLPNFTPNVKNFSWAYAEKQSLVEIPIENATAATTSLLVDVTSVWKGFASLAVANYSSPVARFEVWQAFEVSQVNPNDDNDKNTYITWLKVGQSADVTITSADSLQVDGNITATPYISRNYSYFDVVGYTTINVNSYCVLRPYFDLTISTPVPGVIWQNNDGSIEMNATAKLVWHIALESLKSVNFPTFFNRINANTSSPIIDNAQVLANYETLWRNCKLTTSAVMTGQDTIFKAKVSDVLKSLSMLYGCVFVEQNNKYNVYKIDDYFTNIKSEALPVQYYKDFKLIAGMNYDRVVIGDEGTPYELFGVNIFRNNTYSVPNLTDEQRLPTEMQLTCPAMYDGVQILLDFLNRNKDDKLKIISLFFDKSANPASQNWWTWFDYYYNTPTIPNQKFADNEVIKRLAKWIKSFLPTNFNSLTNGEPVTYQATTGIVESDGGGGWIYTITSTINESANVSMASRIFKPYKVTFSMMFSWAFISQFLTKPVPFIINGKFYYPIELNTNIEPNAIDVVCLEYE